MELPPQARGTGTLIPSEWCGKTSVFLLRETGMSEHFVGRIKGAKYRFDLQYLTCLAACHQRGMVCSRLSLFSPLFRARVWRCLRLGLAFRGVDIPQSGLLAQIILLR